MEFEWDLDKAARNFSRHHAAFGEVATVFGDPLSMTVPDPDHSIDEDRYIIVGMSRRGRLLSDQQAWGVLHVAPSVRGRQCASSLRFHSHPT